MHYVMSDLHGNLRRFASVMEQIALRPEDTLYVLGDVIDRHPDGVRLLRELLRMDNARLLLGNHEDMMLKALRLQGQERQRAVAHWYRNGGEVTHKALMQLDEDEREALLRAVEGLPLSIDLRVNGTAWKLVHAAPVEAFAEHHGRYPTERSFAVWKRWEREDWTPEDYTLVFGHTPTDYYQPDEVLKIWFSGHRIGIDCGSGFPDHGRDEDGGYGRLACLRLEDLKAFYSEEDHPDL